MIAHDGTHITPDHGAPTLREIGIGLGRTPRFAGHTHHYYNVLAHSLAVAAITPTQHRVYALLHDAHEAILGDMVTTWKAATSERHELEERLQARIYISLGLPWPSNEAEAEVKRADALCLAAEAHILGHPEADLHWPANQLNEEALHATTRQLVVCQTWLNAERAANRYELAYKRHTREADPRRSMPPADTFLEAAAAARG